MKILYLSPDAVQREFEAIDEVNSCDNLISYFNSFDWEKGNAIITKRKSFDLPYSPQILRFQRSETDYVDVSPQDKDNYFVTCVNGKLVFETFISGNINNQQFSIEEFLEDFWAENLIDKYSFEEIKDDDETGLHSSSQFGIKSFWPLLFLLIVPVLILVDKKKIEDNDVPYLLWFWCAILVFLSPYFILLYQYFKYNGNAELDINRKKKTITFTIAGQTQTLFFKDITKAKIVVNEKGERFAFGWGYLLLEAGPKERMIITNFLYEDYHSLPRLLQITPVNEPSFYPLIRVKIKSDDELLADKNEYDLKVQEFTEKWSEKTKEELLQIKANRLKYTPYAVEAAINLLKKKKVN